MKRTLVFAMAGLDWMPVAHAQVPAGENVMKPAAVVAVAHFVAADVIDYAKVLPMPPAAGSLAAAADLAAVRQAQAWRTEGQVAWAKLVEKDVVFNHAAVVGVWFAAERLPLTAAFFQRLGEDLRAVDGAAKKPFLRARPTTVDAGVVPCVTLPASTSYPSGSAMQSWMWAELLAEALPAERDALRVRAQRAGWGRVIGGVHFPSDVVAGQWLGEALLGECRKSAAFRAAWEPVRAEIAAAARVAGRAI